MGEGVEVWRGGVATWECDAMGHLNVAFYVAKCMEGLAGLAAELGMPQAFSPTAQATLIVREQHIRFIKEARPGAPLSMTGGVLEIGETDARLLLLMRHRSGEIAAAFQTVVVHATAAEAQPFPWPARVRERAEALMAEVPPQAAPRSIGLEPVTLQASLERAIAAGLQRTGMGMIGPADCDVFGRMRTEMMMSRVSDGIPHLIDRAPMETGGVRVGGAAMEYRLVHLAWPRAGDRVELRSGLGLADARFRRLVHWLLDPATGRPWGVSEAVAVSFDLDTRKIITLSDAARAEVNAKAIRGIGLTD